MWMKQPGENERNVRARHRRELPVTRGEFAVGEIHQFLRGN